MQEASHALGYKAANGPRVLGFFFEVQWGSDILHQH